MGEFNQFIDDMEIKDIPLVDKKLTWYRSSTHSKSRLDIDFVCQWGGYIGGRVALKLLGS